MILKILLSIVIIGISTYLGFLKSRKLYDREYILRDAITFLSLTKNEIIYMMSILPNAYEVSRQKLNTRLKFVIGNIVQDILENKDIDKSIIENINNLNELSVYDKNVIISCLKTLGRSDIDGQTNIIDNTISVLKNQIVEACDIKQKNSKMYKTIGTVSRFNCSSYIYIEGY
ncbi:MAG: hypothetical protein RSE41_09710 [Clostridia bacterium]